MDSKQNDDAATAAASDQVSRPRRRIAQKLKAPAADCLLVAGQVALSCYDVRDDPRRPQLLAVIAVAYAAAVALTLLARRLDARVPLGARERWMKLAARVVAALVINVPTWLTKSSIPTTLLAWFIWIGRA